jgi:hypothetical protein
MINKDDSLYLDWLAQDIYHSSRILNPIIRSHPNSSGRLYIGDFTPSLLNHGTTK